MGMDPLTQAIMGSVASTVIGGIFGGGKQNGIQAAVTPPAAPVPQVASTPSAGAFATGNKSAAAGGPSSTELSGVGGIDPSVLKLGRNTLLGT